jgi:hypothetical protein
VTSKGYYERLSLVSRFLCFVLVAFVAIDVIFFTCIRALFNGPDSDAQFLFIAFLLSHIL